MHLPRRVFVVVVHDVAPPFLKPLRVIGQELRRLAGTLIAGAVVPRWHGGAPAGQDPAFVAFVQATFGEVLLHGFEHRAPGPAGLVGWLTDGADELGGLRPDVAGARLRSGRALLANGLGTPVRGLVAPAWQTGPVTPALLARCGLDYLLGFRRLCPARGAPLPLAVWSWDWGRIAAAGLAGEALGAARRALWPGAIPCVVLHPRDLARGYLGRALRLIEGLRAAGWRPALPGAFVPAAGARWASL